MAKPRKAKLYPNNKTEWSYFMQAIEPSSTEINQAFPEYHPMWIIQSQRKSVSSENFRYMRENLLNMTRKQCAAYLRVTISTIQKWESKKEAIPFAMFEVLRLVYESVHFKVSHKDWQGWFIGDDGRLVSPDRGNLSFHPNELSFIREVHQVKSMYERDNEKLREENKALKNHLSRLHKENQLNNFVDELENMETKLSEMMDQFNEHLESINQFKFTAHKLKVAA